MNPQGNPKGEPAPKAEQLELSNTLRISYDRELDRIRVERTKILDSYDSHAEKSPKDVARLKELGARKAFLLKALGCVA